MSSFTIVLLATACGAAPAGDAPTADQVRATIRSSIPYIQEKGQWWIEQKKCVSCHRVGTMVWSLGAARQRGFPVSDRLDEWFDWSIETSLAKNDKGKIVGAGNKDGLIQLLLTRHHVESTDGRRGSYARLAAMISNDQEEDGSWPVAGTKQKKRDRVEETATYWGTTWAVLALTESLPKR